MLKKYLGKEIKKVAKVFPSFKVQKILETSSKKDISKRLIKELITWKIADLRRVAQMISEDGKPPKSRKKAVLVSKLVELIESSFFVD